MKLLINILSSFGLLLSYAAIALAHDTEEVHEEPPAAVDPVVAVIVIVAIAVGAFLIWKFVLKKKEASKEASPPKPS